MGQYGPRRVKVQYYEQVRALLRRPKKQNKQHCEVSSNKRCCGGGGTKVLRPRTAAQPPQLINTTGSRSAVRSEPSLLHTTLTSGKASAAKMSETNYDEYEHYNYDFEKDVHSAHSGKQRTKKEASEHTNHFDPSGHSRKILTKLQNTETNHKSKAIEQQGVKAKQ